MTMPHDVLVIGAGLAGATAARSFANAGLRVLVLDKGRGPGGRLSTRRTDYGGFDHGAAVLQAVGADFRAWLDALVERGVAARWAEDQWVGVPGMNAVVAHLLDGLAPRWSTAVTALRFLDARWQALDASGTVLGTAPRLVMALPAPQARALLASLGADGATDADLAPDLGGLSAALASARYAPCWAAMAVTATPACEAFDPMRTRPDDAVLERVMPEFRKPGRSPGHWVLHARADWSERHLEHTADDVAARLREAFIAALGLADGDVWSLTAHRWRYALPTVGVEHEGLPQHGLLLAGDVIGWRAEAGVPPAEQAWRSGRRAAAVIRALPRDQPKS